VLERRSPVRAAAMSSVPRRPPFVLTGSTDRNAPDLLPHVPYVSLVPHVL
jgi:hypothetical protein